MSIFKKLLTAYQSKYFSSLIKNGKILPFPKNLDDWWYTKSTCVVALVLGWGKLILQYGNKVTMHNHEMFKKYVYDRPKGVPLITACNHASMLDDPALIATMLDFRVIKNSRLVRWTLAAREICFTNSVFSYFLSLGKVVPVIRGDGVYQPAVDFCIDQLNNGDWVHIFPEGKVTLEPIRLKWGIGRLTAAAKVRPIVLPFWHVGMNDFLPSQKPYIPRLRKKITILFGEPLNFDHIFENFKLAENEVDLRLHITNEIQDAFFNLKKQAEFLHSNS